MQNYLNIILYFFSSMSLPKIQNYGILIFIGILLSFFFYSIYRKFLLKKSLNFLTDDKFLNFFLKTYFFAFFGGKIFFIIFHQEAYNFLDFFSYGFSILGSFLFSFYYFLFSTKKNSYLKDLTLGLPVFLNIINLFGRIGCLSYGCCSGEILSIKIQLFSIFWYFLNFLISLLFLIKLKETEKIYKFSLFSYLFAVSFERIIFDFFRNDKILFLKYFSLYQVLGILIFIYLLKKISKN